MTVNMQTMDIRLVRKVRYAQHMVDAHNGEGGPDIVELQAQVSGHEAAEKASRIQAVSFRLASHRQISLSLHVVSEIANRQRRTLITCCFSSLTTCIRYEMRTPFWIKRKNW